MISSRLDTDHYKLTMSQMLHQKQPNRMATFSFINRTSVPFGRFIFPQELKEEFARIREMRLSSAERFFLQDKGFSHEYIEFLDGHLPEMPTITVDADRLNISVEGNWAGVTLWEIPILATVNEIYFREKMKDLRLNVREVFVSGEEILLEKAKMLADYPDLKFVDFGSRRRFAEDWHGKVIAICLDKMRNNIVGTSNDHMAHIFRTPVVGTMAHECFMGYSRLFGNSEQAIRDSQHIFLQDWWEFYGEPLSVALTDTFGTKFFFETFTPEQAELWNGLRQDSGDPRIFGYKAIEFYKKMGIDPKTKTIVFSDGLTFPKMIELWNEFHNEFNVLFGIGTNLTNDMGFGLKPLSIVVKLSAINGLGTVKLSDNIAKAMGSEYNQKRFMEIFDYDNTYYEECAV